MAWCSRNGFTDHGGSGDHHHGQGKGIGWKMMSPEEHLEDLVKALKAELVHARGRITDLEYKLKFATKIPKSENIVLLENKIKDLEDQVTSLKAEKNSLSSKISKNQKDNDITKKIIELTNQFQQGSSLNLTQNLNRSPRSKPELFYYFDMEMIGGSSDGSTLSLGQIIVETRPDLAPKMCQNFKSLVLGYKGYGYKGSAVFQCWKGESIITGDFTYKLNGRSSGRRKGIDLFPPDNTRLPAKRGSIGMRRSRLEDTQGLVGSQFRLILQDNPRFTAIFGYVVSGLEVVERISELGDAHGNPRQRVLIANCGSYY